MKHNTVDVYFYVNNKQQPELLDTIANCIASVAGVKKAGINPRVKQLLAVEYDPSQVAGSELVKFMKKSGYSAAMVGM
jgi:copper chaperone CopZ